MKRQRRLIATSGYRATGVAPGILQAKCYEPPLNRQMTQFLLDLKSTHALPLAFITPGPPPSVG
ncbi:MAG: hypothetical protein H0U43_01950 [Chthoniobacterales bacterium]|nr:hypothetical protein [Chthoniobacterales bacterium]